MTNKLLADTQAHWEAFSTIRSRPRRLLATSDADKGNFYPLARQPLCVHPEISKLGEEVKRYLLVQSAYKYIRDITVLETEIVNRATLTIVNNQLPVKFSHALRRDALTIIVDEAYHAYVAMDCLSQIEGHTGIMALDVDDRLSVAEAIERVRALLPPAMGASFELIAVCIAENTNTQDILAMVHEKELNAFFNSDFSL